MKRAISLMGLTVLCFMTLISCSLPFVNSITFTQQSVVANNKYDEYTDFNSVAKATYLIPGLSEGFIPQGMDVWEEEGRLLISGYFKDKKYSPASAIMEIDLDTGTYLGHHLLKNATGFYNRGHAGGIAITDKNLFISNNGKLLRISLSSIKEAGKCGTLTIEESINVPVRASFCNYSAGVLWVGDFYTKTSDDFATPEWRHLTDENGNSYGAWTVGYRLADTENEFDTENWDPAVMEYATPDLVLATQEFVQGFSVTDEYIAISCSYGRQTDSHIMLYNNILDTASHSTVTLNGKSVPLWFLATAARSYTAPPMSQALAVYEQKLLILYESGATFYKNNGGKNPTDHVWSMRISE